MRPLLRTIFYSSGKAASTAVRDITTFFFSLFTFSILKVKIHPIKGFVRSTQCPYEGECPFNNWLLGKKATKPPIPTLKPP